jgi:hypothetical protein
MIFLSSILNTKKAKAALSEVEDSEHGFQDLFNPRCAKGMVSAGSPVCSRPSQEPAARSQEPGGKSRVFVLLCLGALGVNANRKTFVACFQLQGEIKRKMP